MPVGTWMTLGGLEITNHARLAAYMSAMGHPYRSSCEPCWTDALSGDFTEIVEFTNPCSDDAPWYNQDRPESEGVCGFLLLDAEGLLDSQVERTIEESAYDGGVALMQRRKTRRATFKVAIFAMDCCSANYAFRWLANQVRTVGCSDCDLDQVEFRSCCPPLPADLDAGAYDYCGDGHTVGWTIDEAARIGYQVARDAAVTRGVARVTDDVEDCGCLVTIVEFELAMTDPYLYGCPEVCVPVTNVPNVTCQEGPLVGIPGVQILTLDQWLCEPFQLAWCDLEQDHVGQVGAIVEFYTGQLGACGVTVSAYTNGQGVPCADALNPVNVLTELGSVQFGELPANATLTVDLLRRRATLVAGDGTVTDAMSYSLLGATASETLNCVIGATENLPVVTLPDWPCLDDCGPFCVQLSLGAACCAHPTQRFQILRQTRTD